MMQSHKKFGRRGPELGICFLEMAWLIPTRMVQMRASNLQRWQNSRTRQIVSAVSASALWAANQCVTAGLFLLELIDRSILGRRDHPAARPYGPYSQEDCDLLAVIAHWRVSPHRDAVGDPEPLLLCLEGLLTMTVRRLEIVVVTNDEVGALAVIHEWRHRTDIELLHGAWRRPNASTRSVRVEGWRGRWPRRHGFFLTWHHKKISRRALNVGNFTHLLYLEDDIRMTRENLSYWLVARQSLAASGSLPGFLPYERVGDSRVLVEQTAAGQHYSRGSQLVVDGLGPVSARVPHNPYQACYLADRNLTEQHLRSSPLRSPLRSRVIRWGVRERAAAGPIFGPLPGLLRSIVRPWKAHARPIRSVVLVQNSPSGGAVPVHGALIEHVRPTYSRNPDSPFGKVPVEEF